MLERLVPSFAHETGSLRPGKYPQQHEPPRSPGETWQATRLVCKSSSRRLFRRLLNRNLLVPFDTLQNLANAAGPPDLDLRHRICGAQTEMQPLVAGGLIAAACRNRRGLTSRRSRKCDLRSDRIAVALSADQLERDPMIRVCGLIQ